MCLFRLFAHGFVCLLQQKLSRLDPIANMSATGKFTSAIAELWQSVQRPMQLTAIDRGDIIRAQVCVFVCFVLYCFVLFCIVLFCFVLFCFVLFCFVLFCFVLFCSVLFCFVCLFVCLFVCFSRTSLMYFIGFGPVGRHEIHTIGPRGETQAGAAPRQRIRAR